MILQNPREENSLDQLLPVWENIPINSVLFLDQYVSFLLHFQLFHIFLYFLYIFQILFTYFPSH